MTSVIGGTERRKFSAEDPAPKQRAGLLRYGCLSSVDAHGLVAIEEPTDECTGRQPIARVKKTDKKVET
jgi:hypothetical protein